MINGGKFYPLKIIITLLFLTTSCKELSVKNIERDSYDIATYIWPSTHHDERFGNMLWPDGEGEWEVIKKGDPRFEGHYQPKVPLWGYEMDNDPQVMNKWINTASKYGVNVFIFDWYWFDGGPFLEGTLNDGFLHAKDNNKMKFYIMWANHDVRKDYWNVHKFKDDSTLMWKGAVGDSDFKKLVNRVINQYFKKDNYYKIDGNPVFSIFLVDNFIKGLGGMEEAKNALEYFREETRKAGFDDLHLQLIVWDSPIEESVDKINRLGANSATKYNWVNPVRPDYIKWGTDDLERREKWDSALQIPYFANVSIGYDDSPRFPQKSKEELVHLNQSPTAFSSFLEKALEYADNHPNHPKLITIFALNEWIEGSYLLPDIKYGYTYFENLKNTLDSHNQ